MVSGQAAAKITLAPTLKASKVNETYNDTGREYTFTELWQFCFDRRAVLHVDKKTYSVDQAVAAVRAKFPSSQYRVEFDGRQG